jgi:hypothetical protein
MTIQPSFPVAVQALDRPDAERLSKMFRPLSGAAGAAIAADA